MTDYQQSLDYIDSQFEHMKQMVHDWSAINSGSYHLDGLAAMLSAIKDNFLWLDGDMEEITLKPGRSVNDKGDEVDVPLGKALRITKRPNAKHKLFLCGHYDTVFGKDNPFQTPVIVDDNTINGPGVADLKGGLVVMLKALEALEQSPHKENIGWEILINPDEEIGSPGSDALLKEAAERNHIGLIYEPSLPDGTIVSERKGSGNFTLVVHGTEAHAGREFHMGRNAIVKLSDAILKINALNGKLEGTTINPGVVEGGTALNTVPGVAMIRFNIRVQTIDEQQWIEKDIYELVKTLNREAADEYYYRLYGGFTRPPKKLRKRDQPLWTGLLSSAEMLNLTLKWRETGGCCDGNNLAAYGLSNIDTLGVRGGNIHSDKEYILLDSLTERAKLSALFMMRLGSGEISLKEAA